MRELRSHGAMVRSLILLSGVAIGFACSAVPEKQTRTEKLDEQRSVSLAKQGRSLRNREHQNDVGSRPNVLVIAIDNLRADRLSSYGGPNPTSELLDDLASQGTRFAYCLSQAPYSPHSWASLMSSLHVSSLPVRERAYAGSTLRRAGLEPYHVTLPEAMQAAGYVTAGIVQGWFTDAFGLRQGFDVVDAKGRSLRQVVTTSVEWLENWSAGGAARPFFLFSYSIDVHAEFMEGRPPDAHVFGGNGEGFRFAREQMQAIGSGDFEPTAEDLQNALTLYDEGIYWTDKELAPLLSALDRLGVAESTIVVVVSDHGEAFGEHGGLGHGLSNFAEAVNVPFIVYDPRYDGAIVVPAPVMNIDVLPTILDLVGAPVPAQAQGLSLAPSIRGAAQASLANRPVFSEGARNGFVGAVVAGNFKLMVDRGRNALLFDVSEDPEERHDLADQMPEVVESLEDLLFLHKRSGAANQLLLSRQIPILLDEMALPVVDLGTYSASNSDAMLSKEAIEELRRLGYLQ